MGEFTQMSLKGLVIFFVLIGFGGLGLQAQVLQNITGAVRTATEPAKDSQKVLKEVAKPATEANRTISTVEKAPKTVENEYGRIGSEADRTKSEYQKTADKLGLGGNKKDDGKGADSTGVAKADSTTNVKGDDSNAATNAERKSTVPPDFVPEKKVTPVAVVTKKPVDPMDVPRPIPPGSRDNKTPSGPLPASEASKTVVTGGAGTGNPANAADVKPADMRTGARTNDATADAADGRVSRDVAPVVSNPATENTVAATDPRLSASADPANDAASAPTARYVDLKNAVRSGERRPKPDYSHSPARVALEKAEFDVETLEDLFRFSNWEGPEREHTVRAVAQALDELQQAIVEIKKLDPGQSTWRFEETYKDTKAAYITEMKRGQ
jgi:hypothetical protein